MRIWSQIIDALLCAFAGWTLCYQAVLLLRWSAWLVVPLSLCWLGAMIVAWRIVAREQAARRRQGPAALVLLALASMAGMYAGASSQWNDDFFSFYYRARLQLLRLDQPIIAADVAHTGGDLPGLSSMHALTSGELLAVMTARALSRDPLEYCLWFAGVPVGLMVIVHALLLRRFGLAPWLAVAGAAVCFAFLCLDLWQGRCLGAALAGSWSGKVAHWLTLTPLITLYTLRCLTRPTLVRQLLLGLSSIAAVGLSGSALFMTPLQVAGISLAYLAAHRWQRRRWRTVLLTLRSQAYCLALMGCLLTGVIPTPRDASVWHVYWPQTWIANLALVWSTPWRLARDLFVVLVLPLLALRRPQGRYLALISTSLLLICLSPLSGPILIRLVLPGAYWRLIFLLPVTAGSGLLAVLFVRRMTTWRGGLLRCCGAVALVTLVFLALDRQCLTKLSVRPRLADKLPADANQFYEQFAQQLAGRNILAPEELSAFLPIRLPTARFEVTRYQETLHLLANAGRPAEAAARVLAQAALSSPSRTPDMIAALQLAVEQHRVNAVVCPNPGPQGQDLMAQLPGSWRLAGSTNRFLLLLADEADSRPLLSENKQRTIR